MAHIWRGLLTAGMHGAIFGCLYRVMLGMQKKRKHGTCNATRNNKMKHFACTVSMALQRTSFTKCYIEDQHKIIAEKLYFKPRKRIYTCCLGTVVSQSCLYFYETLFSGTFALIRGTFDCERCIKFMSLIVSTSDRLWRQSPKMQLGPRTGGVEPEKKKVGTRYSEHL